jgi:tetratricopeptide (TPR) repeat protein
MRAAREESLTLFREAGDLWGTAWATHCLGRSAAEEGDHETARRLHEEAERLFRAQGDPFSLAYPLIGLGNIALRRGEYDTARRYFTECLAIRDRYGGQSSATANALENLAMAEWCLGDWQTALGRLERGVELRRVGGMRQDMARGLLRLGQVALSAGELERAGGPLKEGLSLFRKHGDRNREARAIIALGRLAHEQHRWVEALSLLRDGLALAQAVMDRTTVATALEETAAFLGGQAGLRMPERAGRLLGAAEALRRTVPTPVPPPERARREQQRAVLSSVLGDTSFQAAWAMGQTLSLEQAVTEAMQALAQEAESVARN